MQYPESGKKEVRVRFAPSPTGPLHAGNIRTAVFNWLFAKHNKGKFILRIEDTDQERSKQEYTDEIINSLTWLGMVWDEGPYFQTPHLSVYVKMLEILAGQGKIYPCFCTPEQLEKDRKIAAKKGVAPVYAGNCRNLSDEERERRARSEPYAPRFKVEGEQITYQDALRGEIVVDLKQVGDFIVARADGRPTYNFATAVDDAMMKISHVIRGEDHISNTPRQLLVMEALAFEPPIYAHLPLMHSADGAKLSKRDARSSFTDLIGGGYLPEAVWNFLALIGWTPGDKKEEMDINELVEKFSLERVSLRSAQYDTQKLDWLNRQKIKKASAKKLVEMGGRFVKKYEKEFGGLPEEKKLFLAEAVRDNMTVLADMDAALSPFFEFTVNGDVKQALADYPTGKVINAFLGFLYEKDFKKAVAAASGESGITGKPLYMPLRAALTGSLEGPELKYIYDFLEPEERARRMQKFLEFIKK